LPPEVVVRARADEADVALGVTEDGEKEHPAPVGRPLQVKVTGELKLPPSAVTVMVELAVCPFFTLIVAGEAETV
jgi:hypothetical protein